MNIDDLIQLEVKDDKIKKKLSDFGIKEYTYKNMLIMNLIKAGMIGDINSSKYLLDNAKEEQKQNQKKTALQIQREKLANKKRVNKNTKE